MSITYPRTMNSKKKPVYKFTVTKGLSGRDLKVTFAHNNINPIFLVDEQGEPQLGWRVDFQQKGNYDFDSLPQTLQPAVRDAVNEILDRELEYIKPKVRDHNSVSYAVYETVCEAVVGIYDVEEVFMILGRSHALEFDTPLSPEALNVAHRSLKNFTDVERLEDAGQKIKDMQDTIDGLQETLKDSSKKWKEYMIPSQDVEKGVVKLIRDLETGWISYHPGASLEDKVLDCLGELEDLLPDVWNNFLEEFD